jgi:YD repeat-containing protein
MHSSNTEALHRDQRRTSSPLLRALLAVALLLGFASPPLRAEMHHPNNDRGIQPNKVYDVLGLDTVNTYNGNLTVKLPIGQARANNGSMTWGLNLVYNSKIYDYRQEYFDGNGTCTNPGFEYQLQTPTRHSNAGLGWNVSLGRLISPDNPINDEFDVPAAHSSTQGCDPEYPEDQHARTLCTNQVEWSYEAADGGQHYIGIGTDNIGYSDDGTFLRMREVAAEGNEPLLDSSNRPVRYRLVEFPDGSTQKFEHFLGRGDWRLVRMKDAHGNKLVITYVDAQPVVVNGRTVLDPLTRYSQMTIADDFGRTAVIDFAPATDYFAPSDTIVADGYGRVVKSVTTDALDESGAPQRVTYNFFYQIVTAAGDAFAPPGTPPLMALVLTRLETPHTDAAGVRTAYTFSNDPNESDLTHSGELSSMTLPTGGRIEWGYGGYIRSTADCTGVFLRAAQGVTRRRLVDAGGTIREWSYADRLNFQFTCSEDCPNPDQLYHDNRDINGECSPEPKFYLYIKPRPEASIAVKSPDGRQVVQYHNVMPPGSSGNCPQYPPEESSLPFTRRVITAGTTYQRKKNDTEYYTYVEPKNPIQLGGDSAWLSTVTYTGCETGTCVPEQATYVRYDYDGFGGGFGGVYAANARVQAQRTVFFTDHTVTTNADTDYAPNDSTQVLKSDWDQRGHYRVEAASGLAAGISAARTTTTAYSPVVTSTKWLLEHLDSFTQEEGGRKAVTLVCMDQSTGFVSARRIVRGTDGISAAGDVVHLFDDDGHGNVSAEHAGLATGAASGSICGSTISDQYRLTSTYDHGIAVSSSYASTKGDIPPFKITDLTIEPTTGLVVSSKDAAGVETKLAYDLLGRLRFERRGSLNGGPFLGGQTEYKYWNFSSLSNPARLEVFQRDRNNATDLAYSKVEYDSFGRVAREWKRMPEGLSVRETTYTPAGEKATISEAGYGAPHAGKTTLTYDQLGRVVNVQAADGSSTQTSYQGLGTVTKTVSIHRTAADMDNGAKGTPTAATTQTDSFGRLVRVTERSGAFNTSINDYNPVTTTYSYDVGNRLATVSTTDDRNVTQIRRFTYDAAGFLLKEEHPELTAAGVGPSPSTTEGTTYDGYDAEGHAATKTSGSGASAITLKYEYDSAERLRFVNDGANNTLEAFLYDNLADPTSCSADCGRLLQSTRHNRFPEGDYTVTDRLTYDNAGRLGTKTTTIASPVGTQTFTQDFPYNDLNLQSEIHYPTCSAGCTGANTLTTPSRNVGLTYNNGYLTAVGDFASSITYHPSGLVHTVQHVSASAAPLITETIEADDNGLPRPKSITFNGAQDCSAITAQPAGGTIASGGQITLTVGTSPNSTGLKFEWFLGISGDESQPLTPTGGTSSLVVNPQATTNYWVKVSDSTGGCSTNSSTATVEVCQPLTIKETAPASQTIASGQPASLYVTVTGNSVTYKWYHDSVADANLIAGVTGPAYSPTVAGNAVYVVVVSQGGVCPSASQTVTFSISLATCNLPTFNYDLPLAALIPAGNTTDLSVSVNSDTAVTYEWHNRSGILSGVTGPTLAGIGTRDWDVIWVKASNSCGTIYSTHTHLKVVNTCPLPPMTVDQTSIDMSQQSPNLTFTASCDWVSLKWQWYRGESGDTRDPVNGNADHPNQLTVQPLVGQYWVRVSTSCGTAADSPTLRVYNGSANCGPIHVLTQPADVADSQAGAGASLSVDATAQQLPYLYEWSDVTHNTPAGYGKTVTVSPTSTTQYQVTVSNTCGYVRSRIATVHVTSCSDINVAAQPQDRNINQNDPPVVLSINATAAATLSYQWYTGNSGETTYVDPADGQTKSSAIAGATGPSVSVTPGQTTKYWVRVSIATNACAIDSRTVTINVCRQPVITKAPPNQTVVAGQQTWLAVVATGDNLSYDWFQGSVGNTTAPLGSGATVQAQPYQTTDYWVRITSACTGEPNAVTTAPVTLTVCPSADAPTAAATLLMPGTATTLTAHGGGAALKYKWYIGASGDTSHPLTANANDPAAISTGAVTAQTHYWYAVTSGACTMQSADIQIDVCTGPSVTWGAAQTQVTQGFSQLVNVTYAPTVDTQVTYYKGTPGDVANSTVISGPTVNAAVQLTANATATYWARATNGVCYGDSAPLTITVCVPSITTQPAGTMIDPGGSADLTVVANTASTYQWYVGNAGDTTQPVAGTSGQQATLHVTPSSTTSYWVRVTGSCAQSVNSATATVSVCVPAAVQSNPISRSISANTQVTLSVTANGTNLSYQWYQGAAGVTTTPLGTNSPTLAAAPSQTTDYWVRVTGRCGSADSSAAKLSVYPAITAQPAPVNITRGTTATFSVTASGTQLSYEWYRGVSGDTANKVASGATLSSYTTPALTADTTYWVRVYSGNAYTDSTSATATICVNAGWTIASQAVGQPSGGNVTLSAANPDANTTYRWYQGSSGDTTTSVGTGSSIVVHPTQTTSYWMRATSATCYADSNSGSVVICTPAITTQPSSVSVAPGAQVTLSVTATGTPTLAYQWYLGASGTTTSPVSGATSSSLTFTASSTASYWCRVTNGTGGCTANSAAATVTICNAPTVSASPQILTPNAGQSSTLSVTASGTSPSYQWYVGTSGTTTTPFGTSAPTQSVGPQQTTDYWVKVTSSCGVVNSPTVKVSVTPIIGTQPADTYITSGTAATFSVYATGAQLTYQWYRGAAGDISNPVANATGTTLVTGPLTTNTTYWVKIASGLASAQSTAATAYVCQGSQVSINQPSSQSSATVTLSIVNPNGTDTYKWYRGNSGDTANLVADTGTSPSVQVAPAQTTNYWVRTTSATCYANSQTYTVSICTPKITAQPASVGITGGSTTLSVTATGDPTLTYQWYQGTSGTTTTPIANATSSSLTVSPGQTTSYWVRVSNGTSPASCYVNSNTATVTVCNLPSITSQPVNQTVFPPTYTTTLSVTASGATSYQWYIGQAPDTTHPIASATAASVGNMQFNDTTYVWVRVSNACGSVNSNSALISAKPTIYGITGDVQLTAGSMATWSVSASGSQNHYSWWLNNVQQPNTDSPSFTAQINANANVAVFITSGNAQASTGSSATICDSVHVTYGPTKQITGNCRYLTVNADDPSATYQWYQGARGVTTTPVGSYNSVTVCPTTATTYWCRVTAGDGSGCYTDSAAVTAP